MANVRSNAFLMVTGLTAFQVVATYRNESYNGMSDIKLEKDIGLPCLSRTS